MRTSDEMKSIVAKFLYDNLELRWDEGTAFDKAEELCTLLWPAIGRVMSRPVEGEPVWDPPKKLTLVMEQLNGIEHADLGSASRPSEVARNMYAAIVTIRDTFDAIEQQEVPS